VEIMSDKACEKTAPELKSITLGCPCCGEPEASICVNLAQLDDEAFTCLECDAAFTVTQVRSMIRRWAKVLSWLEAVPTFGEGD
jgi:transcription elongation factor Elf1